MFWKPLDRSRNPEREWMASPWWDGTALPARDSQAVARAAEPALALQPPAPSGALAVSGEGLVTSASGGDLSQGSLTGPIAGGPQAASVTLGSAGDDDQASDSSSDSVAGQEPGLTVRSGFFERGSNVADLLVPDTERSFRVFEQRTRRFLDDGGDDGFVSEASLQNAGLNDGLFFLRGFPAASGGATDWGRVNVELGPVDSFVEFDTKPFLAPTETVTLDEVVDASALDDKGKVRVFTAEEDFGFLDPAELTNHSIQVPQDGVRTVWLDTFLSGAGRSGWSKIDLRGGPAGVAELDLEIDGDPALDGFRDEIREAAQAGWFQWAQHFTSETRDRSLNVEVTLGQLRQGAVASASPSATVPTGDTTPGGRSIERLGTTQKLITGNDVNGDAVDGVIELQSLPQDLLRGNNGLAETVFAHELGHLLGFLAFDDLTTATPFDGDDDFFTFKGSISGTLALADGQDRSHLASGLMAPEIDDPGAGVTDREIGVLADLGLPVQTDDLSGLTA